MKVNLFSLSEQYEELKAPLQEAVLKVMESTHFIMGEQNRAFEKKIEEMFGLDHAVGVSNGTDALILALRVLNVGPGDEVITVPFTFFASAEASSTLGATPVFVDIDPDTFCMDVEKLEAAITGRTKAIIPVHLFGQMCDMDPLMEIASRYNIPVIEDACQAIGSRYKGKYAGTIGTMGCFSFFPTKNLGCFGDGGMITTNDPLLAKQLRMLRVHGSQEKYKNEMIGYNSRLDEIQAAILNIKVPYLVEWTKKRQEKAAYYETELAGLPIRCPVTGENSEHIFHQYTVIVDENDRDALQKHLQAEGIGTAIYYPVPVHLLPVYQHMRLHVGSYPITEQACRRVLSLPMYPELPAEEQKLVTEAIKRYYSEQSKKDGGE